MPTNLISNLVEEADILHYLWIRRAWCRSYYTSKLLINCIKGIVISDKYFQFLNCEILINIINALIPCLTQVYSSLGNLEVVPFTHKLLLFFFWLIIKMSVKHYRLLIRFCQIVEVGIKKEDRET